jgi:muramoyltetrapeptide carboxypeptidase
MTVFPWPNLRVRDRVAVITPAGPADLATLERGCELLRAWGLEPVLGARVNTGNAMTAGSDDDRIEDLEWALSDPSIAAVFCGRGGYGILRILEFVRWKRMRNVSPKPVVGFSDVTCLHAALRVRLNWPSVHGPHIAGGLGAAAPDSPTVASLRSCLFDGTPTALFDETTRIIRHGAVRYASLEGGNLAMLAAMCGSAEGHGPKARFVAVLEDVNEAPYRVDRMLTQLLRSGWFQNAVGVICGSWKGCEGSPSAQFTDGSAAAEDTLPRNEVEEVLLDRLFSIPGPLLFDAPFGHSARNITIPFGVAVQLDTALRELTYSENE